MKKSLFNPLLLLAGLLVSNLSVAQVTPISGVVEPEISTAESPKWYTMMSSHLTASDRQNRFMKWDGSNLCTDQLTTPPTDAAYIWRLEKADGGDNYCVLVHSSGMRIVVPVEATAINNTMLEMSADEGAVWVLATSASTGQQQCADKQYCLDYTGISEAAYLNAADTSWDYGVTVYEMGTHQASGWFFYPAQYTPPTATKTVSVKSADSAKGSVSIEGKESTSVEVPETEALIVKATAADNYMFYRWVEEGTETVISYRHTYSYEGAEDKTLVAEFVEKDYPIMTRFYVTDLNQQNRYLGSVSYTAGDNTGTLFTCATQEELPFTEYKKLHTPQVEGAVIDKTENPIRLEEGVENFSMNFKQYNEDITYNNGYRDIVCEPEIVWSYQTLYIDWNNDKEFSGENEIYAAVGNNSGDNTFDDPDGNVTEGWDRTITVPAETAPGTYRMRVVYMGPDPWSNDWPSKVFTEFYNEIRNGIAYDFEIAISPASGIEGIASGKVYYDAHAGLLISPNPTQTTVYNLSGQIVLQVNNTTEISVSSLEKGVYIANVGGEMIKFIK